MKKNISIAIPGLVGLEKHMEEIFSLSNKLEEKILEAAKIISFPLLDLLSEREAILLLNIVTRKKYSFPGYGCQRLY
jgi:hypothetical protein